MSRSVFYCACGARLQGGERLRHRCPRCSRCQTVLRHFVPPDECEMTAGYYLASAWPQFANPGEVYICDACMWADPRYVAAYGSPQPPPPEPRPRSREMADTPRDAVEEVLREFLDGSHEPYENLSGDQECATCWRLWPCSSRQLAAEIARLRTALSRYGEEATRIAASDIADPVRELTAVANWLDSDAARPTFAEAVLVARETLVRTRRDVVALMRQLADSRTALAAISERTVGEVGDAITRAEGGMLWTDDAVNRIVANATRQSHADAERWQKVRAMAELDANRIDLGKSTYREVVIRLPWIVSETAQTPDEYADALRALRSPQPPEEKRNG